MRFDIDKEWGAFLAVAADVALGSGGEGHHWHTRESDDKMTSLPQRASRFLLVSTLAAVALGGCSISPPADSAEVTVTADGGSVSLGAASISIPAGALAADTIVTLSRTEHAVPDSVRSLAAVYSVDLHGASLAMPAELVIPIQRAPSADAVVYALTFDDSGVPVNGGGTLEGQSVVVATMHFSLWTVVEQAVSAFVGVVSALQSAWSDLQWKPTDPACRTDTLLWRVTAQGGDSVSVCGDQDTESTPSLIRINNRRLYPQFLRLAEYGLTVYDEPSDPSEAGGSVAPVPPTALEHEIARRVFASLSEMTPDFTVLPGKGSTTLVLPLGDSLTGTRVEPAALAVAFQLIVDVLKTAFMPVQYVVSLLDCIAQDPSGVGATREAVAVWFNCADAVAVGWELVAEHPDTPPAPEYPPPGAGERTTTPTARCVDGTLSYAKNWSGACSSHGGIAKKYQRGSAREAIAQTVTKVMESLTVALADAPMVADLLTRGIAQGPSSQQVLAERRPFIATGPLGESWDAVGAVYDLVGGMYEAARTYEGGGQQALLRLVPPGGLAFSNAHDPPQSRVWPYYQPLPEPDDLAGPTAASALVQLLQTPPRWTTCPETGSVELVYGIDSPGGAYHDQLRVAGYSPEVRSVITDALNQSAGYRVCISRDGMWRSFSRPGAPAVGTLDWSDVVSLDCRQAVGGPLSRPIAFADTTGDGTDDVFVVSACAASTSSWPDVLDVYDGASDPTAPRHITELLGEDDGVTAANPVGLRGMRARSDGATLIVYSNGFAEGDPLASPSLFVTDTFALSGPGAPSHLGRTVTPAESCSDRDVVVDDRVYYATDINAYGVGCDVAEGVVAQDRAGAEGNFTSGTFACSGSAVFTGQIFVNCYDPEHRTVSYYLNGTGF